MIKELIFLKCQVEQNNLNLRKTKQYQPERAIMTISRIASQTQTGIRVHGCTPFEGLNGATDQTGVAVLRVQQPLTIRCSLA